MCGEPIVLLISCMIDKKQFLVYRDWILAMKVTGAADTQEENVMELSLPIAA